MRIVQSFWSKPSFGEAFKAGHDSRAKGGWLEKQHYFYSWALSCLKLTQFYDEVELVTDSYGKYLLIDQLGLPYTSVSIELDKLENYNPSLWTLGKILAYQLQTTPFLHVDSDVFIWQPFSKDLISAPIIAQNPEENKSYYAQVLNTLQNGFYTPRSLQNYYNSNSEQIIVSNTGIVGGSNIAFFQSYTDLAFDLIDTNHSLLNDSINIGAFSVTAEQYLFHYLAEEYNAKIHYLYKEIIKYNKNNKLFCFYNVPVQTTYVHPVSSILKKKPFIYEVMENRLRKEFPIYYYRIKNLIKHLCV